MSVVLMSFGTGIAQLKSVENYYTSFCVSSLHEREGTVGFGSANIEIMYVIDWHK